MKEAEEIVGFIKKLQEKLIAGDWHALALAYQDSGGNMNFIVSGCPGCCEELAENLHLAVVEDNPAKKRPPN